MLRSWAAGLSVRLLCPALVLASVWWPEAMHYRIDKSDPPLSALSSAARVPDDGQLSEIGNIDLAELNRLALDPLQVAWQVAAGYVSIPGLTVEPVRITGFPADFLQGPPTFQLFMASLSIEDYLLRAHAATQDPQWLALALQRVLALAEHERNQSHDRSFLWNDHAVASRVSVLVQLWAAIRRRDELLSAHGLPLMAFAQRSGRLLAKADHFTVRTNHGVMQNLALLQLSAAFPDLPEAAAWRQLARNRLTLQLGFYVSPQGVVLEHSAGYHLMGSQLLAAGQHLLALNGLPALPALDAAVANSRDVLARLRRPDGSLPLIGNTAGGYPVEPVAQSASNSSMPPAAAATWQDATAGWAWWWWSGSEPGNGPAQSQVMLAWGHHPGHGHLRAIEGSLYLWANGVDWLGAVGYWPYGASLGDQALSWRAANAVHAPGESTRAPRQARLLSSGSGAGLNFADIERTTPGGSSYRRQVVQIDGKLLLALDFVAGSKGGHETVWTLGPNVRIQPHAASRYEAMSDTATQRLSIQLQALDGAAVTSLLQGSETPFGGWTVMRGVPMPGAAIELQRADSQGVTASLFELIAPGHEPSALEPARSTPTPLTWSLRLKSADRLMTIRRQDALLVVESGPGKLGLADARMVSLLSPPSATAAQTAALRARYQHAVKQYPPWRDLLRFRTALSIRLLWLALGIEAAWFAANALLPRWRSSRFPTRGVTALAMLWLGLGLYSVLVYLKP